VVQQQLEHVFGMMLTELPAKEKTSLKDRRAAAKASGGGGGNSSSSKSWVLTSTLPAAYRDSPEIFGPGGVSSTSVGGLSLSAGAATARDADAVYTALYTLVVSLILLNSGTLADAKLNRYFKRLGVEAYTPLGPTDKVLARMVREGYVERRRDTSSGEETVEWVVGPRGRVEVGVAGVAGLVRGVYAGDGGGGGRREAGDDDDAEVLERKIRRSLGLKDERAGTVAEGEERDSEDEEGAREMEQRGNGEGRPMTTTTTSEPSRRGRRRATAARDVDEDYEG